MSNCLVPVRSPSFLEFSDDSCTAVYSHPSRNQFDIGTAVSKEPLLIRSLIAYCEALVFFESDKYLSIGISLTSCISPRHAGCEKGSIGLRTDGFLMREGKRHVQIPPLRSGDVVGVGVNLLSGTVFFTLNGKKRETLSTGAVAPRMMLSLHGLGQRATVNCSREFLFDLRGEEALNVQLLIL